LVRPCAAAVAPARRWPGACAEAAGVAAAGIPSPRRVPGEIRRGRRRRGAPPPRPPQAPRAPAADGGTLRPTSRAWAEDRERRRRPPPTPAPHRVCTGELLARIEGVRGAGGGGPRGPGPP